LRTPIVIDVIQGKKEWIVFAAASAAAAVSLKDSFVNFGSPFVKPFPSL
jgi:hypothetical protein